MTSEGDGLSEHEGSRSRRSAAERGPATGFAARASLVGGVALLLAVGAEGCRSLAGVFPVDGDDRPVTVYVPPGGPVADPTLTIDARGVLYAAWWGRGVGEIFLARSTDRGRRWSEPLNVSNTPLGSDFPVLGAFLSRDMACRASGWLGLATRMSAQSRSASSTAP